MIFQDIVFNDSFYLWLIDYNVLDKGVPSSAMIIMVFTKYNLPIIS